MSSRIEQIIEEIAKCSIHRKSQYDLARNMSYLVSYMNSIVS